MGEPANGFAAARLRGLYADRAYNRLPGYVEQHGREAERAAARYARMSRLDAIEREIASLETAQQGGAE